MKNLKLLSCLLLTLFVGVINVNATTEEGRLETGLCAETRVAGLPQNDSDRTCRLIDAGQVGRNVAITGGGEWPGITENFATRLRYQTDLFNNTAAMCLDPGIPQPNPARYGRSLGEANPSSPNVWDRQFANVFATYVFHSQQAGNWGTYLEHANVALRAIMQRHGFIRVGQGSGPISRFWRNNNLSQEFSNNQHPGSVAQRFYRCAVGLQTEGCGPQAIFFDFRYSYEMEEDTCTINGDNFECVLPITLTGFAPFSTSQNLGVAPFFRFTEFAECGTGLQCSISAGASLNQDISTTPSGDAREITVTVTGPVTALENDSKPTIRLDFEYFHILSASNVWILRTNLTGNVVNQRMMVFNTETNARLGFLQFDLDIEIPEPEPCECRFEECEDGEFGYCFYLEGDGDHCPGQVTFEEWLSGGEDGCCPPPIGRGPGLPSEYDVDTFFEICLDLPPDTCDCNPFIDQVSLAGHCPPPGEEAERVYSFVRQVSMETILASVRQCQDDILNVALQGSQEAVDVFIECVDRRTRNNRDDVYLFDGAGSNPPIEENIFCRLFTSEESTVNYPGQVTNAWGGTYFSFTRQGQPSIEAKIDAHFFFNIELWRVQYYQALNAERDAFTRWQRSLAWESAISNLNNCTQVTCPAVTCGANDTNCTPCAAVTGYTGTNSAFPSSGQFFTAGGADLSGAVQGSPRIEATRTCNNCSSCSAGSQETTPNPYEAPAVLEGLFIQARNHRIQLEGFYDQCEARVDIRDQWEWLHNPEMFFVYEQMVYNAHGDGNRLLNRLEVEANRIPMVPVCAPGTECPEGWTSWDEMSRTTRHFWPNYSTPLERTSEGCERSVRSQFQNLQFVGITAPNGFAFQPHQDQSYTDCHVSEEETRYFKSDTFFQALSPSGMFMTREEVENTSFEIPNIIDVDFVMNIRRTAYRGIYDYWFVVDHVGHHKGEERHSGIVDGLGVVPEKDSFPDLVHRSNIQHSIDRCIAGSGESCSWRGEHPDVNPVVNSTSYAFNEFVQRTRHGGSGANGMNASSVGDIFEREFSQFLSHQCTIFVENLEQEPPGEICIPDDPSTWTRPYFHRPISLTSIAPTHRDLSLNWNNGKGDAALLDIQSRGDSIFETPEYQFQIGPQDTAWIREQNRARRGQGGFNDFNLQCNQYGKECISRFITDLADRLNNINPNRVLISGRDSWRYFENNVGTPGGMFNWHDRGSFSYPRFITDLDGCETNPETCYWP